MQPRPNEYDAGVWSAKAEIRAAHEPIRNAQAVECYAEPVTVADVLGLPSLHGSERCELGKKLHLSHEVEGVVRNGYTVCRNAACPRCAPGWVDRVLKWALFLWEGQQVYSYALSSWEEYASKARGGLGYRIKHTRPEHLAVRTASGAVIVFMPGEVAGVSGEPVPCPGVSVVQALLQAPAYPGRGVKRYRFGVSPPRREPTDWIAIRIPEHVKLATVNRVTEQAVGRPLVADISPCWRNIFHRAYTYSGLAPDEVRAVREAIEQHVAAPVGIFAAA